MILVSLLFIPIFGLLTVSVYDRMSGIHSPQNYTKQIKFIGLLTSTLNLIISLIIFIKFDFSYNQFQFVQKYNNISYYDFYLGIDGLSVYFILLTCIIMPISLLSNWTSISKNVKSYVIIILLLETFLLLVFLTLDVLLYYVFFESILFPLFILIGLYGSNNKIRASFYLFLYTLIGSLFLLLSIISMYTITGVTDFDSLFKVNFGYYFQFFIFYGIFLSFAIKTPTIFLNNWLLKAHVESPLGGSLILASVVLKLSLYGIVRLILPILPKAYLDNSHIIYVIGVITIIYASIATLRTIDVKELIAYSSVSHAAVYFLGVFSNNIQGIEGAIIFGLAHGFVSSGLFICTGGILYDRSGNRLITIYRGLTQIMPIFSILFFILCLANAGTPLTFNFLGEFMCLYGAFEKLPLLGIFATSSIVFSAAYSMYMLNRIIFGGSISRLFMVNISDINKREFFMVVMLIFFTISLGIYPSVVTDGLNYYNTSLIYNYNNPLHNSLFFFLFTRNKYFISRAIIIPSLVATIITFSIRYLNDMFSVFMFITICSLPVIEAIMDSYIYNTYLNPFRGLFYKIISIIIGDISLFGNKLPIGGDFSTKSARRDLYNSIHLTNQHDFSQPSTVDAEPVPRPLSPSSDTGSESIQVNPGDNFQHYPTLSFPTRFQSIKYDPFIIRSKFTSGYVGTINSPEDPTHLPVPDLDRRLQIEAFIEGVAQTTENDNINGGNKIKNMFGLLSKVETVYGNRAAYGLSCELRKIIFNDPVLNNKFRSNPNTGVTWSRIGLTNKDFRDALTRPHV